MELATRIRRNLHSVKRDFNSSVLLYILFFPRVQLPEEQKAQLKGQVLLCVSNEPNKGVRKKYADLAAEVARNLTDDDGNNLWPEFLKVIIDNTLCITYNSSFKDRGRKFSFYILENSLMYRTVRYAFLLPVPCLLTEDS